MDMTQVNIYPTEAYPVMVVQPYQLGTAPAIEIPEVLLKLYQDVSQSLTTVESLIIDHVQASGQLSKVDSDLWPAETPPPAAPDGPVLG